MFNVGSLVSVPNINNGKNLWVKEFLKSITSNPRLFFLVEIRFIMLYHMMKRGYYVMKRDWNQINFRQIQSTFFLLARDYYFSKLVINTFALLEKDQYFSKLVIIDYHT